jgi:hypothetical protein
MAPRDRQKVEIWLRAAPERVIEGHLAALLNAPAIPRGNIAAVANELVADEEFEPRLTAVGAEPNAGGRIDIWRAPGGNRPRQGRRTQLILPVSDCGTNASVGVASDLSPAARTLAKSGRVSSAATRSGVAAASVGSAKADTRHKNVLPNRPSLP